MVLICEVVATGNSAIPILSRKIKHRDMELLMVSLPSVFPVDTSYPSALPHDHVFFIDKMCSLSALEYFPLLIWGFLMFPRYILILTCHIFFWPNHTLRQENTFALDFLEVLTFFWGPKTLNELAKNLGVFICNIGRKTSYKSKVSLRQKHYLSFKSLGRHATN